MVLDFIHVNIVHGHMVAGAKTLLFLLIIWADLYILIIKKYILVLGVGPTQGLDNTTIKSEAKYPINFTRSGKRFFLCLHYNGGNSFLFANAVKAYQSKQKIQEQNHIHCV